MFSLLIFPTSGIRDDGLGSDRPYEYSLIPVSKVFLIEVSGFGLKVMSFPS